MRGPKDSGLWTEPRRDYRRGESEPPRVLRLERRCYLRFTTASSQGDGAWLLLQHLIHKLEQRLRRRIVRQAEILVQFAVVGFLGREALGRNAGVLQHGLQPLRLRARIGMVGHVRMRNGGIPLPFATCVMAEE